MSSTWRFAMTWMWPFEEPRVSGRARFVRWALARGGESESCSPDAEGPDPMVFALIAVLGALLLHLVLREVLP